MDEVPQLIWRVVKRSEEDGISLGAEVECLVRPGLLCSASQIRTTDIVSHELWVWIGTTQKGIMGLT